MLTDAQKNDCRRFMGYPLLADTTADDSRDFAYGWVSPGVMQTLEHRLNNLRPEEATTIINVYLANLTVLESAIPAISELLSTAQAAVWTRNPHEIAERSGLFDGWRRRLCDYIGFAPGPGLRSGNRIVRT